MTDPNLDSCTGSSHGDNDADAVRKLAATQERKVITARLEAMQSKFKYISQEDAKRLLKRVLKSES